MRYLNEFIWYEFMGSEVKGNTEIAIYLLKICNDDKHEFFLYKSFKFPDGLNKPFRMTDVFEKLMYNYAMYVVFEKDYDLFMDTNTLQIDKEAVLDGIWLDFENAYNKLINVFGKENMVFFIRKFVKKINMLGMQSFMRYVDEEDIKEMLFIDLEKDE